MFEALLLMRLRFPRWTNGRWCRRWLSQRKAETRGTYVPFGFSSRTCPGGAIARAQLILVCELFSHSFRVEMAEGAAPSLRMEGISVPTDLIGKIKTATAA